MMTQAKAQTMQQRFGFQDKELSTPKHDEIMLWLDQWVDTGLQEALNPDRKWKFLEVTGRYNNTTGYSLNDFSPSELPEYPETRITEKVWECPILDKNYTIGFSDMRVLYSAPILCFDADDKKFHVEYEEQKAFFEVKPSIPSLGEVIRQIRMYQTYTNQRWFIVSPDTTFKNQLAAQGIGFVEVHA